MIAALLLLAAAPVVPPSPAEAAFDRLARRVDFADVSVSPDGRTAAWIEHVGSPDGPLPDRTRIFVGGPGEPARLLGACPVSAPCEETQPAWSPDGRRLAFVSRAGGGKPQLWVQEAAGGKPRVLTHLDGTLSDPRWSRDGRTLAFLFVEGVAAGPLGPTARDAGVVGESPRAQRIWTVAPDGGTPRASSPPGLFVYEYDWSPDGESFAGIAAEGSGDDNWWIAKLYLFRGATARVLRATRDQLSWPRFSPDGRRVAFIEGLMSDEGLSGGDVWTVVVEGGAARNLTSGRRASASTVAWAGADTLVFGEWLDGDSAFERLDLASGATELLWRGAEHVGTSIYAVSLSLSADGRSSAVLRQSHRRAPEVWAGPIGAWKQVTHRQVVGPECGEPTAVHFDTALGRGQAWLLPPKLVEPGRRYPVVVAVHGGPAWAAGSRYDKLWNILAASGYYVLAPNPRGSFGQGEAFTRGNVKDFGGGDLRDVLAALDAAARVAPIDPARAGITGWSYGGYLAMWAVTQTTRFRAAVAGAGIANWQSYYGQNRIDQWLIPYFGASVYDDPAVYRKSSPIEFIKAAHTPTLVLQGERDAEVPAPQSYEFWHALRTLGVPTQLVIFPDEGHSIAQPAHLRELYRREVAWFDRWLSLPPGDR